MRGIRSDFLRAVVKAAVSQDFTIDHGGKHPALVCPVCGHHETITTTGQQRHHEAKSKITRLRKHGLVWKGQGGQHA